MLEGECGLKKNKGSWHIQKGDLIIINPGEKHIFTCGHSGVRNFAFNFYLVPWNRFRTAGTRFQVTSPRNEYFEKHCCKIPVEKLVPLTLEGTRIDLTHLSWPHMVDTINQFANDTKPFVNSIGPKGKDELKATYLWRCGQFFNDILTAISSQSPLQLNSIDNSYNAIPLMKDILTYLKANTAQTHRISALANELGYTPQYLCSFFRKHTGMSIGAYANRLKVQNACEYLQNSTLSITEIALRSGFSSSQHLARNFREIMKMSSSEYRSRGEV